MWCNVEEYRIWKRGAIFVRCPCKSGIGAWSLFLTNVFIPHIGILSNVVRQQRNALLRVEIDNFNAKGPKPLDPALEISALSNNDCLESKLANQPAAIPAGSERCDHDLVAIAALPAGIAEGIRFAMQRRIAILYAAVVAGAQQVSFVIKNRGPNWDSPFGEAFARFSKRGSKHVSVDFRLQRMPRL